ncbi:MAG: DUF4831 family protein [Bacteroidales bacterium]|nr:DUF4831 family protein [Bacteroidales bacterium]
MTRVKQFLCLLLIAVFAASCGSYRVYSVRSRTGDKIPGGIVYALPHTYIRVAVTIEKTDYTSAPYARYAHDMLGIAEPNPDSLYAIKSIEVSAVNQADPYYYFFVKPNRTSLAIDNRGLLVSIGEEWSADYEDEAGMQFAVGKANNGLSAEYNLYDRVDTFYTRRDAPGHPSMVSSKKDSRSLSQRARAAAERIADIQDKKQEILFGEYEGNYTGEAIQFVYNQLCQQEEQLISQFAGTKEQETIVFWVDPKDEKTLIDSQTVVLFRFNPSEGIVRGKGDHDMVVRCQIRCENNLRVASRFVRYRTGNKQESNVSDTRTFKYRIPETAIVRVYSDAFSFEKEVKVSQFGTIANLPAGACKARFDVNTGDLIYFHK